MKTSLRMILVFSLIILLAVIARVHAEEASLPIPPESQPAEESPQSAQIFNGHERETFVDLARELERNRKSGEEEGNLKLLKEELSLREKELTQIQEDLSKTVQKKTEENENLKLLISLYESLKADEAAGLLKRLPMNMTLVMMQKMNPKKSSKILAAMDPKMAAQVSRLLVRSPQVSTLEPQKGGAQ